MANLRAVLTKPKISENYSRNAFDRSFSLNTSYQLGGLEPIFAEPVIAGSHIQLNRSIFQRTAPVNTAAFPKIDTHVEFFAVPIRLLWMYWNNFKLNIQDFNSSFQGTVTSSSQQYSFSADTPALPYFNALAVNADCYNLIREFNHPDEYDSPYVSRYFGTYSDSVVQAVGARRLLGAFGYGTLPSQLSSKPSTSSGIFMVNPFKLLAYQKVYYDHFRNTAYESNDPSFYNIDMYRSASELPDLLVSRLLRYRYVNYRKDYFQSLYPSLNYVQTDNNGLSWSVSDSVIFKAVADSKVDAGSAYGGQTRILSPVYNGNTALTTVQQIRASFALDKLLRASAYTPKHVKDQFESRYGVKGVESGFECPRIGAFMNDIIIQEVTNTADHLGSIGGKGVGYNGFGKDIEFTAKEDCIVIGVMYSLPRSCYDGFGIANWNAKLDREDFFIPEFMNLGLQPLTASEISIVNFSNGSQTMVTNSVLLNAVPGYQSRYQEYKCGIDRNLGNFLKNEIYSDFSNHTQSVGYLSGFFAGAGADYFKVKPTDLDSVFTYDTVLTDPSSDRFLTHIDIKFICNQNMSVHGQPSANGL